MAFSIFIVEAMSLAVDFKSLKSGTPMATCPVLREFTIKPHKLVREVSKSQKRKVNVFSVRKRLLKDTM